MRLDVGVGEGVAVGVVVADGVWEAVGRIGRGGKEKVGGGGISTVSATNSCWHCRAKPVDLGRHRIWHCFQQHVRGVEPVQFRARLYGLDLAREARPDEPVTAAVQA